jgi:hypothetical protein
MPSRYMFLGKMRYLLAFIIEIIKQLCIDQLIWQRVTTKQIFSPAHGSTAQQSQMGHLFAVQPRLTMV